MKTITSQTRRRHSIHSMITEPTLPVHLLVNDPRSSPSINKPSMSSSTRLLAHFSTTLLPCDRSQNDLYSSPDSNIRQFLRNRLEPKPNRAIERRQRRAVASTEIDTLPADTQSTITTKSMPRNVVVDIVTPRDAIVVDIDITAAPTRMRLTISGREDDSG